MSPKRDADRRAAAGDEHVRVLRVTKRADLLPRRAVRCRRGIVCGSAGCRTKQGGKRDKLDAESIPETSSAARPRFEMVSVQPC
jgi:hypothetical protein